MAYGLFLNRTSEQLYLTTYNASYMTNTFNATYDAMLVGLNSTGNPFYAKNKYSKYGLIDGRCFAIKKTEFVFHNEISTIPDYYASAYHLNKYGGNLILNYCFLDFKRYEKGGLGTAKDRIKDKLKDIQLMKSLFPNNIIIKDKPNEPKGSHIKIKR
jgi:hypothetical protein